MASESLSRFTQASRRPAAKAPATPAHQRRKAARPLELLHAALDEFVEKGFASARAEDVAARAGVSKGTLYLYYPSKEALLKAVIEHHLSTPIAVGATLAATHTGAVAPLLREQLGEAWLALLNSPASAVVKIIFTEVRLFPEVASFYAQKVIEPAHRLIGQLIERGMANREFRAVNVEDAVLSVMTPLVMMCLHKHSLGACSFASDDAQARRFIGNHLDLVIQGLRLPDNVQGAKSTMPSPQRTRKGSRRSPTSKRITP